MTNLECYSDDTFDLAISSEVLEHIKEYGMERRAIEELKRITKQGGLLIIGTPNSEMLGEHSFFFDEINGLFNEYFSEFCIFENALESFGDKKCLWEKRLSEGKVGITISEIIDLSETCLPDNSQAEIKQGMEAGIFEFSTFTIDTTLLHNTHSWIIMAINNK